MMLDPLMLDPEDLEDEEEGMLEFLVRGLGLIVCFDVLVVVWG